MADEQRDFEAGGGPQHDLPEGVHDNDIGLEATGFTAMTLAGGAGSGGNPPSLPPYSDQIQLTQLT